MKCHEIKDYLGVYVDGILSPEEKAVVEGHLEECANCRGELEDLKELVRDLQKLEPVPVPEGLKDRIYLSLAEEFKQKKEDADKNDVSLQKYGFKGWRRITAAAAVVLLGVGLSFGVLQMGDRKVEQLAGAPEKSSELPETKGDFAEKAAPSPNGRNENEIVAALPQEGRSVSEQISTSTEESAGVPERRENGKISRGNSPDESTNLPPAGPPQENDSGQKVALLAVPEESSVDGVPAAEEPAERGQVTSMDIAGPNPYITLGGETVTTDLREQDGLLYLPAFTIADALGLVYRWDEPERKFFIHEISLDGFYENAQFYTPVESFCKAAGLRYIWYPETGELRLAKD